MNIEKAIELLECAKEGWPAKNTEDYYKALELGIGAMKLIRRGRTNDIDFWKGHLPGETKG